MFGIVSLPASRMKIKTNKLSVLKTLCDRQRQAITSIDKAHQGKIYALARTVPELQGYLKTPSLYQ
jgi:hypothetical protein